MSLKKIIKLALYYGFARHLPASNSQYTYWCRIIRRVICKDIFESSGENINIERGAYFGNGSKVAIGSNSGIGVNCKIMGSVSIGNNVMMGPDVLFLTVNHSHGDTNIPMLNQGFDAERPIHISDDVWLGARATLLPGVKIGQGAIIAACAVVVKDVDEYSVVAGNPATVVKNRKKMKANYL